MSDCSKNAWNSCCQPTCYIYHEDVVRGEGEHQDVYTEAFCSNCHAGIDESASYCPNCGARVKEVV